ncbi:MAG: murein biosynthesis integral membrane protein MurJ [Desulfovibrionales bacterium]
MNPLSRTIARNAFIVSAATMLSRVLGLVRDLVTAFVLGAGPLADAFFAAFRLPNLLRRLFAEGSLTIAFIPVFTRVRREQGPEAAFSLARTVQFWLLLILGCIVLLALVFARPLTMAVAYGFMDKDPEIFEFTITLVRICFPYILFISAAALSMGILNSLGHFLYPALAPSLLNVILIAAALAGHLAGWNLALCLAVGVLFAGAAQWLFQQPALARQGFTWSGPWKPGGKEIRRIGWLMLPSVFGASVYQLNIVLSTLLASLLPFGSITYLYYADRLVQFPLGIFGIAISTAALPSLSSVSENIEEFKSILNGAIGLTLFVSLPSAAGLMALAGPIIGILFGRGAFSPDAVEATAQALVAFSVGLPAISCIRSLASAFYAREDTRTPVIIAAACLVMNVGLGYLLMQHMAHVGLALAASISAWANVLLLAWSLHRKVGAWLSLKGRFLTMLVLSALVYAGASLTAASPLLALFLIPVWSALYLWLALKIGLEEADLTWSACSRVLRKKGATPQ